MMNKSFFQFASKLLINGARSGDHAALSRFQRVLRDIEPLALQRAQHVVAVEAGFRSWKELSAATPTQLEVAKDRYLALNERATRTWDQCSEFFFVGKQISPEGIATAYKAVEAKLLGDRAGMLRYAHLTLDADQYANAERTAGRTARRSNVIGNAWSGWYEALTGQSSGW